MKYTFADFELDAESAELRRNGEPVHIEPQVFDLLKLLVASSNRLVSRDEIFAEIWGDRVISDAALSSRIKDARKALGDDGSTQKFIQTVQRRGLRFVGQVTSAGQHQATATPALQTLATLEGGDTFGRPSIAVLPMEDLSPTLHDSHSAQGITDELVDALSAWRYFPVVSRHSAAQVLATNASARDIGLALNARYLVHGTLRRVNNQLKLKVALTSTELDTEIWSHKLTCDLSQLQDVEEEIAAQIASLVQPELERAEARRALRTPVSEMSVWEMSIQAASLLSNAKRSDYSKAEKLASDAAMRAPDWALPHSLVAIARFQMAMTGFSSADSSQAFAPTLVAAERALEIDRSAWMAHALTAVGELWTNRNHAKALLHVEKAIALNPSASVNYHFGGCITGFAGNPEKARKYQERLFRIDPTYPYRAVIEADLGLWHIMDRQFEEAEDRLSRSQAWDPNYGRALQRRISLAGLTGDRESAQAAARRMSELSLPLDLDTIAASYPFKRNDDAELFNEGLRRAGINL